jgi:hypothetical protein
VVTACLLSAVQLFPALQLANLGTRAQAAVWEHTASFSLDPEAWPLLLIPDLLGRGEGKTFNGPNTYWEMTTYVGILPLFLAIFAAMARRKIVGLGLALRPAVWLLAVAALVAIGRWGGLHYLLFRLVPGYRLFRASSRAWVVATLALAWLAAAAYLLVCERLDGRRALPEGTRLAYGLFGLGVLTAIAAPIALPMLPIDAADLWRRTVAAWRFGALAVAASLLLSLALRGLLRSRSFEYGAFGLLLLDLGLQWTPYIRTRPARELTEPPALAERIKATVGAGRLFVFGERTRAVPSHSTVWLSAGAAWGYRDLRGNNPMAPALMCDLLAHDTPQPAFAPPYNPYFAFAPPALLRFGVTALLTPLDYTGPLPDGARRIADDGVFALYRVPPAPRARVVDAAGHDAGTATLTLDGDDEVRLRTCANGSARLVLYDADYPGWSAHVDDQPVHIERVLAFRSVPLAPGCHDVRFTYRERWLAVGAWVTAASGLALAVLCVSPGRRRWTRSHE